MAILLSCVSLSLLCGCASHPLLAVFTPADIPRLPAPTEPSRTYSTDASQTWSAVNRVIQSEHGFVVSSNQQSGVVTFYVDYAPRFIAVHFKNPKEFIKAMAGGKEPLLALLWSRFDDSAKSKLLESIQGKGTSQIDLDLLTRQLNDVIYGPSIFNEKLFAKVSIRKGARELIADNASPDAIPRANRMLLEDGLPKYIGKTTLFNFRPAYTRNYTTVLLTRRNSGSGTIAYVTTWQNGYNPPDSDLSKPFFTMLDKEARR